MDTELRMMGDRVLVRAIEADQTRASGLLIPDVAQEKPQKGIVIGVGPGLPTKHGLRVRPDVEEDDEVLYTRYGGTEITVDGEPLLVLREADILAVIE